MTAPSILIVPDPAAWIDAAAEQVARALAVALRERGGASLVLAGGGTPRPVYERLAGPPHRDAIDWGGVSIFFGDERCVPPDDPASNYRMARLALIDRLPVLGAVHRIEGERGAEEAARRYDAVLGEATGSADPAFDMVVLGLGGDGHTASLFPGDAALADAHLAAPATSPLPPHARVTLTLRALGGAREVVFLVSGADKADVASAVLAPEGAAGLPAAMVRPRHGRVTWLLDGKAASRLRP